MTPAKGSIWLAALLLAAPLAACGGSEDNDNGRPDTGGGGDVDLPDTGDDTGPLPDAPTDVPSPDDTSDTDTEVPDTTDADTGPDTEIVEPPTVARVRVVHGSWDAPQVDIWVNGEAPAPTNPLYGIAFGQAAPGNRTGSPWLELEPGTYDFSVVVTDSAPEDGTVFVAEDVALEAGTYYTLWAHGSASLLPDGPEALDVSIIAGQLDIATTSASVMLGHAATGAGPVTLVAGGVEVARGVELGSSLASAIQVPSGLRAIGVRAEAASIQFTLPFEDATYVQAFVVGDPRSEDGLRLLVVDAATGAGSLIAGDPRIRALHLLEGLGSVDLWLPGATMPLFDGLAYLADTDFAFIPSTAEALEVRAAGGDETLASLPLEGLEPGTSYTLGIWETPADGPGVIVAAEELVAPPAGQLRLRAVHATAAIGEVSIANYVEDGTYIAVIPDLMPGDVAFSLTLPSATYRLGVDLTATTHVDYAVDVPDLFDAEDITAWAIVDADGPALIGTTTSGNLFRLDAQSSARVRTINASVAAQQQGGSFWVFEGDTLSDPIAASLAFGNASEFVSIGAGELTARAYSIASPTSPGGVANTFTADAGATYSMVLWGSQATALGFVTHPTDIRDTATDAVRAAAFHGWGPPTGSATFLFGEDFSLDGVGTGTGATVSGSIPLTSMSVGLDTTGDFTADTTFPFTTLPGGTSYVIVTFGQTGAQASAWDMEGTRF